MISRTKSHLKGGRSKLTSILLASGLFLLNGLFYPDLSAPNREHLGVSSLPMKWITHHLPLICAWTETKKLSEKIIQLILS